LRLAWLGAGFALGPSVSDALSDAAQPSRWVVATWCYAAWAVCLLATLVPRTIGLTVVRIGGPAALAVAGWAAVAGGPPGVADGVALGWAAVVAALSLAGTTADAMVDGSSYGAERRFALRVPVWLLLGPAEAAWLAVVAGSVAGPLLLATGRWLAGAAGVMAGGAAAVIGARALHQLSRRWVVFVPAGVVLHDPLTMSDPTLFPRPVVSGLGPALASEAERPSVLDVTGGAPGLVLEVGLVRGVRIGDLVVERARFTPVRPGAVLAEAARRRLALVPNR
jgi:hypothetical protein